MAGLRGWIIFAWLALPTVMYGGYSLLQIINRGDALTPFQVNWFRAGHAHAGVLIVMSLLAKCFWTTRLSPLQSSTPGAQFSLSASWPSQEGSSCT
jgi:Ni,Fe-hydrogenase I cytochrome b subunit